MHASRLTTCGNIGNIALVSALAIGAAGLSGALGAQAVDMLAGTWTLNVAKSSYGGGTPPKSQTTTLHAMDGGLHEVVERVNADGTMTEWEVAAKYDGKDYAVAGDPVRDTVALTKIDDYTVDIVNKKGGTIVSRMRIVVARDGNTRTNTVQAVGQAKPTVLFFDRQ